MGPVRTYLRTFRRRWHLTQEDLAFIFGYLDQSIIARLEEEERAITLAVAHGCKLLFGVEPEEIFPALFESIEEGVVIHMHELRDRLLGTEPTPKVSAKLTLLDDALSRLSGMSEEQEV